MGCRTGVESSRSGVGGRIKISPMHGGSSSGERPAVESPVRIVFSGLRDTEDHFSPSWIVTAKITLYSNNGPPAVKNKIEFEVSCGIGTALGHSDKHDALKVGSIDIGTSISTLLCLHGEPIINVFFQIV